MKKMGFLLLMLFLLFSFSAYSFEYADLDGSEYIMPATPSIVELDNYDIFKPGFDMDLQICTPVKVATARKNYEIRDMYIYDNKIVWNEAYDDNGYLRTYIWEQGKPVKEISSLKNKYILDFNDNSIVYSPNSENDYRVYLYNINSQKITKIGTLDKLRKLVYDDNQLAYTNNRNLFFKSGIATQVIDNVSYNSHLDLYGNSLVWDKSINHKYQIFYWNGKKVFQLTKDDKPKSFYDGKNYNPSIYKKQIVWQNLQDAKWQIMYWDGAKTTQITDTDYGNWNPKVFNGKVVWSGEKNYTQQIFYWNGKKITQITNDNESNHDPLIYNGIIAWIRGDKEIYTCIVEPPLKPTVSVNQTTNTTTESITLNGKVNPNGKNTEYRFEYGQSSYLYVTDWTSIGNGESNVNISETITGLTPDTTYHYRLVAKNSAGTTTGNDHTFKTLPLTPVKPTVTTDNVSGFDPYILSATINPNSFDTTFYFEYGTDTNYGSQTPESGAGNGNSNVRVIAQITGLEYGTTYHYRVVATNAAGTTVGEDKTFTTLPEFETLIQTPVSKHLYNYMPVELPVLSTEPENARPFAIGDIFSGSLNLQVGLKAFATPVDIYLAISFDKIKNTYYFINSSNEIKKTVATWKSNHTDSIKNVSLYGDIDISLLPKGTYTLYFLVVPTGATNLDNSYLWITKFKLD